MEAIQQFLDSESETFDKLRSVSFNLNGFKHPAFELAQQNPVFVLDNVVYTTADGNIKGEVAEVGKFGELEELALARVGEELEISKQKYVQNLIDEIKRNKTEREQYDTAQLIVRDIFPYLRIEKIQSKVDELLSSQTATATDSVESREHKQRLERQVAEVSETLEKLKQDVSQNTSIGNFAVYNKKVYDLLTEPHRGLRKVVINGQDYRLKRKKNKESTSLEDFETEYGLQVADRLKKQAIDENLSKEQLEKVLEGKFDELERFRGLTHYQEKDFGFFQRREDGIYYVFLDVPEFLIRYKKSFFNFSEYFLSPEQKVMIPIKMSCNSDLILDYTVCYEQKERFRGALCMGSARDVSGESIGDIITKKLKQTRAMMCKANSRDWYSGGRVYQEVGYFHPGLRKLHTIKRTPEDVDLNNN
jgi:hypothetical protein